MGMLDLFKKKTNSKSITEKANTLKERNIESSVKKTQPKPVEVDSKIVAEGLKKYEEYKEYLSEYENNGTWIQLRAQGWTKLVHEILDNKIAEDFQLKPIKERCWASEYEEGRRKVISLFLVNDMYATIKWGWNFEYIPRVSENKVAWVRTDKTIYTHTFRLSEEFYKSKLGDERKSVFGRDIIRKPEEFYKLIEGIKETYDFVRNDIKMYYEKTSTYEGMLSELKDICDNGYYNFLHYENKLVYIGVEKYMGKIDKAKEDLENVVFRDEKQKQEFKKKIGL